ncbi:acetyl-CoA acetyltransferase [Mycobacterium szulgai]|uniref:Acetyl-CoA acetyltransferase n=1 Tax=Mycobacterium szulgai TaxID=1787 RepID=A0A1X2DX35_MYCSZ|nr:CoA transferase [Mycobacterium szulgai]ORW92755.1 acetyl-CoA acetyltransferase [Mycobacterium szulgai]
MVRTQERDEPAAGPLAGVRVIELAGVVMGPLAGQLLGDLGADVIKIETATGDVTRQYQPWRHKDMGWMGLNLNRNKRSVVLDLKSARGRDALEQMLAAADVFLTNLRPASLARLGLSADQVTAEHPRLVYASAHGFRSGTAEQNRAAYDDVVQAASGMVWLNQQSAGTPYLPPAILADKVCGLVLTQSILAALYYRAKFGRGQHVEVPMLDTMLTFNLVEHIGGAAYEPPAAEFGYQRAMSPYHKAFRVRDGWMCVLPYGDRNWSDFFAVLGRPELAHDCRFQDRAARAEHVDELYALVEELTAVYSMDELQAACDTRGVAAAPVRTLAEATDSDYARDGELFEIAEHPSEGAYRVIGSPVRYSATPPTLRRHCPHIGEHTAEILAEFGITE